MWLKIIQNKIITVEPCFNSKHIQKSTKLKLYNLSYYLLVTPQNEYGILVITLAEVKC